MACAHLADRKVADGGGNVAARVPIRKEAAALGPFERILGAHLTGARTAVHGAPERQREDEGPLGPLAQSLHHLLGKRERRLVLRDADDHGRLDVLDGAEEIRTLCRVLNVWKLVILQPLGVGPRPDQKPVGVDHVDVLSHLEHRLAPSLPLNRLLQQLGDRREHRRLPDQNNPLVTQGEARPPLGGQHGRQRENGQPKLHVREHGEGVSVLRQQPMLHVVRHILKVNHDGRAKPTLHRIQKLIHQLVVRIPTHPPMLHPHINWIFQQSLRIRPVVDHHGKACRRVQPAQRNNLRQPRDWRPDRLHAEVAVRSDILPIRHTNCLYPSLWPVFQHGKHVPLVLERQINAPGHRPKHEAVLLTVLPQNRELQQRE
mmetsp:Transcript_14481/g.41292  ORF Transcript_14481/g.41292 Transcript_14481/m.41292 type:complete len:373 (+) Transcript_14481:322-1440(+)